MVLNQWNAGRQLNQLGQLRRKRPFACGRNLFEDQQRDPAHGRERKLHLVPASGLRRLDLRGESE